MYLMMSGAARLSRGDDGYRDLPSIVVMTLITELYYFMKQPSLFVCVV